VKVTTHPDRLRRRGRRAGAPGRTACRRRTARRW
jgi:hypothetical protein